MAVAVLIANVSSDDSGPTPESDAAAYCEGQVQPKLKAPSTATFAGSTVKALDNGRYVVRGSVDAQTGSAP